MEPLHRKYSRFLIRPPRLNAHQVTAARRMYEQQNMTVEQIGHVLGVPARVEEGLGRPQERRPTDLYRP